MARGRRGYRHTGTEMHPGAADGLKSAMNYAVDAYCGMAVCPLKDVHVPGVVFTPDELQALETLKHFKGLLETSDQLKFRVDGYSSEFEAPIVFRLASPTPLPAAWRTYTQTLKAFPVQHPLHDDMVKWIQERSRLNKHCAAVVRAFYALCERAPTLTHVTAIWPELIGLVRSEKFKLRARSNNLSTTVYERWLERSHSTVRTSIISTTEWERKVMLLSRQVIPKMLMVIDSETLRHETNRVDVGNQGSW